MQQLLAIEAILKGTAGVLLLLTPLTIVKLLGLSRSDGGFWQRLLGAVLLGLSGAAILEGHYAGSKGMALGGFVLINLVSSGIIVLQLALEAGAPTGRGRIALGATAALLVVISLIEIAYI